MQAADVARYLDDDGVTGLGLCEARPGAHAALIGDFERPRMEGRSGFGTVLPSDWPHPLDPSDDRTSPEYNWIALRIGARYREFCVDAYRQTGLLAPPQDREQQRTPTFETMASLRSLNGILYELIAWYRPRLDAEACPALARRLEALVDTITAPTPGDLVARFFAAFPDHPLPHPDDRWAGPWVTRGTALPLRQAANVALGARLPPDVLRSIHRHLTRRGDLDIPPPQR